MPEVAHLVPPALWVPSNVEGSIEEGGKEWRVGEIQKPFAHWWWFKVKEPIGET